MAFRTTSSALTLCLLVVSLVAIGTHPAPAHAATFRAKADAHTNEAHPRRNYGDAPRLTADRSPVKRAYLRFAVRDVDAPVKAATLKVFSRKRSEHSLRLQPVPSNQWNESTLTGRTAPVRRRAIDRVRSRAGDWVSLDATPLVQGNGPVSMAVVTPSSSASSLSSREGKRAPRLVVQERRPLTSSSTQPAPPALRGAASHPLWSSSTVAEYDRELDALKSAGATAVRIDLSWSSLETKGKGNFSSGYVARADTFFQHAAVRGLKVIATFWSTPCWASTAPDRLKENCTGEWWNRYVTRYPPRNPQDYAATAAWAAARWGRYMAGMQIWNEPNHVPSGSGPLDSAFWRTEDQAGDYVDLIKTAYPAIKAAAPSLPVIGGALSRSDGTFLERLYDLGVRGSFDVFSVHPYTGNVSPAQPAEGNDRKNSFISGIPWIREIMSRHGDTKPLWLTEFGWSTCAGIDKCVSASRQASYTETAWEILSRFAYVKAATQYNLRDKSAVPTEVNDHFGLLRPDFAEKPAWASFKGAMRAGS